MIGIPIYNTLHQIQLEIKSNALSVSSNLGGGTHEHLRFLMSNRKYATPSPVLYVRPVHPSILQISNNATHVASYELKIVYDENIQVFYKVRGVEQALIQQVVTAVNEQYIISMKNRTTGQFTGNIHQIVVYLLSTHVKSHQVI